MKMSHFPKISAIPLDFQTWTGFLDSHLLRKSVVLQSTVGSTFCSSYLSYTYQGWFLIHSVWSSLPSNPHSISDPCCRLSFCIWSLSFHWTVWISATAILNIYHALSFYEMPRSSSIALVDRLGPKAGVEFGAFAVSISCWSHSCPLLVFVILQYGISSSRSPSSGAAPTMMTSANWGCCRSRVRIPAVALSCTYLCLTYSSLMFNLRLVACIIVVYQWFDTWVPFSSGLWNYLQLDFVKGHLADLKHEAASLIDGSSSGIPGNSNYCRWRWCQNGAGIPFRNRCVGLDTACLV